MGPVMAPPSSAIRWGGPTERRVLRCAARNRSDEARPPHAAHGGQIPIRRPMRAVWRRGCARRCRRLRPQDAGDGLVVGDLRIGREGRKQRLHHHPGGQLGIQPVIHPLPVPLFGDQTSPAQVQQVARHRGGRRAQDPPDLAHRQRPFPQDRHDAQARRVAERLEHLNGVNEWRGYHERRSREGHRTRSWLERVRNTQEGPRSSSDPPGPRATWRRGLPRPPGETTAHPPGAVRAGSAPRGRLFASPPAQPAAVARDAGRPWAVEDAGSDGSRRRSGPRRSRARGS